MDVAQLLDPVLTGGIKDTHFFNGRILTADDLRTMQAASRQHDAQLGRAIGDGVAYGLEVSAAAGASANATSVVLHVTRGLALNRLGDRAALAAAVDVALVRSQAVGEVEGLFKICVPVSESVPTNLGLYLFTIAPASGLDGRAPMTELGTEGVGGRCGSRYEVEGVTFDCRPLTLPSGDAPARVDARALFTTLQTQLQTLAPGAVSPELFSLRNVAAHLLFGGDVVDRDWRDLLTIEDDQAAPGWLQDLRNQKVLTDCEVPLALIYWSVRGIEFVDMWAVRRRLSIAAPPPRPLSRLLSARREAESEARLNQFQSQIETLRAALNAPQVIGATGYVRYLPAAGLLPLQGPGVKGFDLAAFFATTTTRGKPAVIEGARLEMLLRESLWFPSVDMRNTELVWLYLVRENTRPGDNVATGGPRRYAVFARGDMPYFGHAHFDVARWDYSNYALSGAYDVQSLV